MSCCEREYIYIMQYPVITLKKGRERSVLNFHPWIFSGAIHKKEKGIKEGDIVSVHSHHDVFLAAGHYHDASITVRILSFEKRSIDASFWAEKISAAYDYRLRTGIAGSRRTDCFRLVHGEGDGLPGLIIDIYNDAAVIHAHSAGMMQSAGEIFEALEKVFKSRFNTVALKSAEGKEMQEIKFLKGSSSGGMVTENDLKFFMNWKEGQKTGFFLDQRENRELLLQYVKEKKVLNTFSYSGGFSIYALKGGAAQVHSVESSAKANGWEKENAKLNGFDANLEIFSEDVFDFLKKRHEHYDAIILDPPAFAKRLSAVEKAITGYRNLNYEAIKKISTGGILFTFSCSQAVDRELFRKTVFQAAAKARRNVRIMHQLSQPADHPINIFHPEGEYLKGLVLFVE